MLLRLLLTDAALVNAIVMAACGVAAGALVFYRIGRR
jgi:hypothetical protein